MSRYGPNDLLKVIQIPLNPSVAWLLWSMNLCLLFTPYGNLSMWEIIALATLKWFPFLKVNYFVNWQKSESSETTTTNRNTTFKKERLHKIALLSNIYIFANPSVCKIGQFMKLAGFLFGTISQQVKICIGIQIERGNGHWNKEVDNWV